jgi:mRNA interferase RelE/StbE
LVALSYSVEFKPQAVKDLKKISLETRQRIIAKIEMMQEDLAGDVKKLTNFTPEYRLRVGDYRVLFEVNQDHIVIYRVKHRRDVYR